LVYHFLLINATFLPIGTLNSSKSVNNYSNIFPDQYLTTLTWRIICRKDEHISQIYVIFVYNLLFIEKIKNKIRKFI